MSVQQKYEREIPAGTVLFREGERGSEMFVIQRGVVRLTRSIRGEDKELAELGPGEFFGEMAILNNKPRIATATVVEATHVLALDPATFDKMIRSNMEIAARMIKKLAERLAVADGQIETLLLRDANSRVVHCIVNSARNEGAPADDGALAVTLGTDDIVARTGIEPAKVDEVLARISSSGLIARETGRITIPRVAKLEEFLDFLEMRERFGDL